jgi:RimJ/RimL family protein N-acetyltransferase
MMTPLIETERLLLRPLRLDDWDAYATAWADPEMVRFIGGEPRDRNTSWGKFLMGAGLWPVLGYGFWTFAERETGVFVGNGGLARFERGVAALEGHVEAGWAFVPAAWGKGYATEAMQAVLNWADDHLAVPEIRAIIDHGNLASQRVAGKCGFELLMPVLPEMPEAALWQREKPDQ